MKDSELAKSFINRITVYIVINETLWNIPGLTLQKCSLNLYLVIIFNIKRTAQ